MTGTLPPEVYSFARANSWSIIAEPFLDTSHDAEWRMAARAELANRGIKGFNRYLRVAFAGLGLWWNFFWGEWAGFGLRDILWGWAHNLILIGCICIGIWYYWIVGIEAFIPMIWLLRQTLKLLLPPNHRPD